MFNRNFNFFGNSIKVMDKAEKVHQKMLVDERRCEKAENIKRLIIRSSNIDVRIIASETEDIEVHLSSYSYTNGKAALNTRLINNDFHVLAELQDSSIFIGEIVLDVAIPASAHFEQVEIECKSADVDVTDYISANSVDIISQSGDVNVHKVNAKEGIQVQTNSGDVEVSKDIEASVIDIKTKSGDVKIGLVIVKKCIQIDSESGDIEFYDGIKSDIVKVKTMSGDVDICGYAFISDLEVTTTTGDIDISNHVSVGKFKIETKSGDVDTEAKFIKAIINARNGDVDLSTEAEHDITLDITTVKGDIEVELNNIGPIELFPKTGSGDIDCSHVNKGEYAAKVTIVSIFGDIEVM